MRIHKNLMTCGIVSSILLLSACQSFNSKTTQSSSNTSSNTSSKPSEVIQQDSNERLFNLNTDNMMTHLKAFEKIAQQNGGYRAVGSKGGQASAKYIIEQAKLAGLHAQTIAFENREKTIGQNILVEIEGQSKESAILIGAHYDSVDTGPGINDNASGVAVLIELMHQLKQSKQKPKQTIVLAFWDSEEVGIAGSRDYVKKLTPEQLNKIKAYINVDMVGTKDPNILIADADKSSLKDLEAQFKSAGVSESDYKPMIDGLKSLPTHSGDSALEERLKSFFKAKNLTIREDTTTLTASDTAPFLGKVPVTSIILFNEKERPGANEGETILDFAPCYHQACDTIEHVDPQSLKIASDAIIYLINGIK